MMLPADIERAEREHVEKRKPWLAFSRPEPAPVSKPARDHFEFLEVSRLLPVEGEV